MVHVKQNPSAVNDLKLSKSEEQYHTNNKKTKTTIHVQRTVNDPYPSVWKHGRNVLFYSLLIMH